MNVSTAGENLIKSFEGCAKKRPDGKFDAYPDPGTGNDPWTIGWGSTGPDIRKGVVWTQAECDARFAKHLQQFAADVTEALKGAPVTQGQFDAMVSFHYNTGAIFKATLTRLHRARQYAAAAREFDKWNKAGGKALAGLTRRRAAERAMYEGRP
jgi:GH24 family phage-related lysozyme (muramidase)